MATTLVEGLDGASAQIERAFRGAARRELSRHLFTLDAALGFGAADFVLGWFASTKTRGDDARAQSTASDARAEHDTHPEHDAEPQVADDSRGETVDYLPPSRA